MATIEEKIRSNVQEVLARSRAEGTSPGQVAVQIAKERVKRAMQTRRTW